jgi:hypothetical protein
VQFYGAVAPLTLVSAQSRIAHLLSRQGLIDTTTAAQATADRSFQPISHDRLRTRGLKRIAVIAAIMLVIFIVLAVGIYVGVFVILSPMMG